MVERSPKDAVIVAVLRNPKGIGGAAAAVHHRKDRAGGRGAGDKIVLYLYRVGILMVPGRSAGGNHKAERQRVLVAVEGDGTVGGDPGHKRRLAVLAVREDIFYGQKRVHKGGGPGRAVGVGAALHPQLLIDGGNSRVSGGGEDGSRAVTDPGAVVLGLFYGLFHAEEDAALGRLGRLRKPLEGFRIAQVRAAAGGGNAGNAHIKPQLQKHQRKGQYRQRRGGGPAALVQIEEQAVEAD